MYINQITKIDLTLHFCMYMKMNVKAYKVTRRCTALEISHLQ